MVCREALLWAVGTMKTPKPIWVITSELMPWPLAAFTIKRDLVAWLDAYPSDGRAWLHVWDCTTPTGRPPEQVDICDLIGCTCDPGFLCTRFTSSMSESAT